MPVRRLASAVVAAALLAPASASADLGPPRTLAADAFGSPVAATGGAGTTAVAWQREGSIGVRVFRAGRARRVLPVRAGRFVEGLRVAVGPRGEVALTWFVDLGDDPGCELGVRFAWRVAVLRPRGRRFSAPQRLAGPFCETETVDPVWTRRGSLLAAWAFDRIHRAVVAPSGAVTGRRILRQPTQETALLALDPFSREPRVLVTHVVSEGGETFVLRFLRLSGRSRAGSRLERRRTFNGGLLPGFDSRGLHTFLWDDNTRAVFALRRVAGRLRQQRLGPRGDFFEEALSTRPSGEALAGWRPFGRGERTPLLFAYAAPGRRFGRAVRLERARSATAAPAVAVGPGGAGLVATRSRGGGRIRAWRLLHGRVAARRTWRATTEGFNFDDDLQPVAVIDDSGVATILWNDRERIRMVRGRLSGH